MNTFAKTATALLLALALYSCNMGGVPERGWLNEGSDAVTEGKVSNTAISFYWEIPYIAYSDGKKSGGLTVMKNEGSGWEIVGTNTNANGISGSAVSHCSIDTCGQNVYTAFSDSAQGGKLSVMFYNAAQTNWAFIGSGISSGAVEDVTLRASCGMLFAAYKDMANGGKASLMYYSNSSWHYAGSAGFTSNSADGLSMDIFEHIPFTAFTDGALSNKASVMKYDGGSWSYVGAALGDSEALEPSISISEFGDIFLSYIDVWSNISIETNLYYFLTKTNQTNVQTNVDINTNTNITTNVITNSYTNYTNIVETNVSKFSNLNVLCNSNGSWNNVGVKRFAVDSVSFVDIKLSYADRPYLLYANSNRSLELFYFDGDGWQSVTGDKFSGESASNVSFEINSAGTPFIFYSDASLDGKGTVQKYVE